MSVRIAARHIWREVEESGVKFRRLIVATGHLIPDGFDAADDEVELSDGANLPPEESDPALREQELAVAGSAALDANPAPETKAAPPAEDKSVQPEADKAAEPEQDKSADEAPEPAAPDTEPAAPADQEA